MAMMFLFSLVTMFLPLMIILLSLKLKYTEKYNREKSSPFECGFDPKKSARLPFSARFFLLAMVFLIFDVEIVMLMPLPLMLMNHYPMSYIFAAATFLVILLIGLIHEWKEGSLTWAD